MIQTARSLGHALVLAAAWAASAGALAAPAVSEPFAMRMQNSANSQNVATGDILFWGANEVMPAASSYGFSRQCPTGASCTSAQDPDYVRQSLFHRPFDVRPNQYFASRPYDPALTGPWTLVLSSDPTFPPVSSGQTAVVNTPAVGNVNLMPFVASMTVSGTGVTPTVSWTLPGSLPSGLSVDQVRILIFDVDHPVTVQSRNPGFPSSFSQGNLIFLSDPLPGNATGFAIPAAWTTPAGPRSLSFGTHYSVGISLEHLGPAGAIDSRSQSFFDFTPISLPGVSSIFLPTTAPVATTSGLTSGALYSFKVDSVSPTETTFIDPFVATGYTYQTGSGDPNFKSVQVATNVGDGLYDIFILAGSDWFLARADLAAGAVFDFVDDGGLAGGVDRFQIRGIETSAGLSPFDLTAFVTGLTFVSEGSFTGTMQAIAVEVAAVPEPQTLLLALTAGLALLGRTAKQPRGPSPRPGS